MNDSYRNVLFTGNVLDFTPTISDNSVDVIVTSPPYHKKKVGVRNYGINAVEWNDGMTCVLGEEYTENEYVMHSMEIYSEMMRILKPTGLFFLNVGYTFSNNKQSLVPEKLVIAMEEAGFPRAFTIWWHKPNPTPTQGGKRPRHDYEPIYVFAKSEEALKQYYFDKHQLRRPIAESTRKRNKYPVGKTASMGNGLTSRHTQGDVILIDDPPALAQITTNNGSVIIHPTVDEIETYVVGGRKYSGKGTTYNNTKRKPMKIRDGKAVEGAVWTISNASNYRNEYCPTCDRMDTRKEILYKCKVCSTEFTPQRNCPTCDDLTDITVICSYCKNPTHGHHAMFPETLIEKILKCACPIQVCSQCGEPHKPIYKPAGEYADKVGKGFHAHHKDSTEGMMQRKQVGACNAQYDLVGYEACNCTAVPTKALVFDPFMGYGTTAVCADRFGAYYCGSDVHPNNIKATVKRVEKDREDRKATEPSSPSRQLVQVSPLSSS